MITEGEVRCATHNVEWTLAGVNSYEADAVGTLNGRNGVNARDDDVLEPLANVFDTLHHQAEVVHRRDEISK